MRADFIKIYQIDKNLNRIFPMGAFSRMGAYFTKMFWVGSYSTTYGRYKVQIFADISTNLKIGISLV